MVRLLNEIKWGYNTFCSYGILPQVVLVAFWRQLIVTFCGSLTDSKYPPLLLTGRKLCFRRGTRQLPSLHSLKLRVNVLYLVIKIEQC